MLKGKVHASNLSPIASDAKPSLISKLEKEEIEKIFGVTLEALDWAVEFIENNKLKEPERIDYVTYLLGAFVFIGSNKINHEQKAFMIERYNGMQFSNKDNGERRKAFEELITVKDIV